MGEINKGGSWSIIFVLYCPNLESRQDFSQVVADDSKTNEFAQGNIDPLVDFAENTKNILDVLMEMYRKPTGYFTALCPDI